MTTLRNKRRMQVALGVAMGMVTAWTALPDKLQAADHIDFPDAMLVGSGGEGIEQAEDISDLLVWTPQQGKMAIVLNVASQEAGQQVFDYGTEDSFAPQFSDAVDYQIRLQPVKKVKNKHGEFTGVESIGSEHFIKCHTEGNGELMSCFTPAGTITTKIGYETDERKSMGVRLFVGQRADSFPLDFNWIKTTIGTQIANFQQGKALTSLVPPLEKKVNFSDNFNVLSIVLELDVERVFHAQDSLYKVVAEAARRKP